MSARFEQYEKLLQTRFDENEPVYKVHSALDLHDALYTAKFIADSVFGAASPDVVLMVYDRLQADRRRRLSGSKCSL